MLINYKSGLYDTGSACRTKLNKGVRVRYFLFQRHSTTTTLTGYRLLQSMNQAPMMSMLMFCYWIHFKNYLSLILTSNVLCFVSNLFQKYARSVRGLSFPNDILELSLSAAGRTNVVYSLAQCIGTKRPGTEKSCLPVTRMPMGLLEHCVNFFSSSN